MSVAFGNATPRDLRSLAATYAGPVAAVVAATWWLVEVTRAWAGRDAPSVTVGAALLAVAVILLRPDRVLPRATMLAAAISVGAFVVPLSTATGWKGAPDAAIYACGAWLAITIATVVTVRPQTRVWLLTLVALSAAIEFMSGWLAWWGGEDPAHPMVGTFYWHNPYAAFLIPGGLIGLAFWLWRERIFALVGLLCFTFATIGIVYSTSRASLACFVLGVALVAVAVLVGQRRWRGMRQLAIAGAIAVGLTIAVGGPPFFPHRASPFAAEQVRTSGQSLGQNGGYRIDFWREALTVFGRHPGAGGGFKSLAAQSHGHVPSSWPLSPYAHNGYLQALGEGGLALGVPFLLAAVVIAFLCLRAIYGGLVRRRVATDEVVVAIALGCVMLHSGVDFDWTYAAGFAMTAALAGLLVGAAGGRSRSEDMVKGGRARRLALSGVLVVGVGLLGLSSWVMRNGNHEVNVSISAHSG